jgi:hypothetical protein
MAVNNLRVIYQNITDLSQTNIIASTTTNSGVANFTATLSNTTLQISTVTSGTIAVGMYLTCSQTGIIPANIYIVSGSGTTWTLNQSVGTWTVKTFIGTLTTVPTANLQKDSKSLVWRSTGTTATLTVNFNISKTVRGVVLPFTNLTSTATINVTLTGGSVYTTGTVLACPYAQTDSWDTSYLPTGANSYAYGSGTYARAWFPSALPCAGLTITITDTNNTAGYIEASRLIIGDYWSPTHNTSFGLTSAPKSLSSSMRTESGDLVTNRGIQYNSMNFDLTWLTPADRAVFTKIIKANGINKPLLISLFPDASEDYDKEQTFQIYGKLTQVPDLTHPMYSMYSSMIEIEEI